MGMVVSSKLRPEEVIGIIFMVSLLALPFQKGEVTFLLLLVLSNPSRK